MPTTKAGVVVTEFPANPKDGTVFQTRQGLFFIFEKASNAWVRVAGSASFPLATPWADGLMAAADLRKINRLYVPFPTATLSSDQCQGRFVSGNIDLFSLDDFVRITGRANLHNAGRLTAPLPHNYRLTLHTAGFDFGINKDALIKYLLANGQLVLRGPTGPKGRQGPPGAAGNKYPTGPKGPPGVPGTSPACQLTIAPDSLDYQRVPGTNKAIVDIQVQPVTSTTYAIVLKQGVIGNPNINPDQLQVNCSDNSTWVLAVAGTAGSQSPLYYLDVSTIMETIKAKYESELQRLKAGNERIVQFWLSQLMSLFDAEKAALCCALFNCLKSVAKIPKPRDNHPQPLLMSVTSGNPPAPPPSLLPAGFPFQGSNLPAGPVAPVSASAGPVPPGNLAATSQLAVAASGGNAPAVAGDQIALTVTGINLGGEETAAVLDLTPGRYRVVIDDCCLRVGQHYAGDVRLIYNSAGVKRVTQFPRVGRFTQPRLAANAYGGLSLDIRHAGGLVGAYYPAGPDLVHDRQQGEGYVRLRFLKQQETLLDRTCSLTEAQVRLFAHIWADLKDGKLASGRGLVTRIAGQDYILVLANEPAAVQDADCVAKFGNAAIAWPTLDGETFLEAGPGPFTFKLDKDLNELVAANIAEGLVRNVYGCAAVASVEGNLWISKSAQQVLRESFVNVLFPVGETGGTPTQPAIRPEAGRGVVPVQGQPFYADVTINLSDVLPGRAFNGSICAYRGRTFLAVRRYWDRARIAVMQLDPTTWQPQGAVRELELGKLPEDAASQEDPRLFVHRNQLYMSYGGTAFKDGELVASVCVARLSDNLEVLESWCPQFADRQPWEKNWGCFSNDGDLYAVYTISPHRVLLLVQGRALELPVPSPPARLPGGAYGLLRGGAPPILHNGEYYSWFHGSTQERNGDYSLGLYTFAARHPFEVRRWCPTPLLRPDPAKRPGAHVANVIFPAGAIYRDGYWHVSYGLFDQEVHVVSWDADAIERLLVEVPLEGASSGAN